MLVEMRVRPDGGIQKRGAAAHALGEHRGVEAAQGAADQREVGHRHAFAGGRGVGQGS